MTNATDAKKATNVTDSTPKTLKTLRTPASTSTATGASSMIANDLQYRVTRTAAREFEAALARLEQTEGHRSSAMRALMRAAMESQLEDLRQQLAAYEALRAGHIEVFELDSLTQLPEALIRARIAAGLTQKDLAKRLGMREQQVQRYEATRYGGVGLTRLQAVADALGVHIHERVILPTAATMPSEAAGSPAVAPPVETTPDTPVEAQA
ncbi:MAG: helix-turn-helix domain-containing protein [Chloroflexota bacterium]